MGMQGTGMQGTGWGLSHFLQCQFELPGGRVGSGGKERKKILKCSI